MGPIDITNISQSGREATVTLQVANTSTIFAVNVKYMLLAGGRVDRYSNEGAQIRVKTQQPHGLAAGDRVFISDSAAVEANGHWSIANVIGQEFTLIGSVWKGNSDPGNGTWVLIDSEYNWPAALSGSNWQAVISFHRPGVFQLQGQLLWDGTPHMVRSPAKTVTVT